MPRAAVGTDDTTPCVIIDNGSGVIKAGFAGDEEPKVIMPASGMSGVNDPIKNGIVQDWDAMEEYWDQAFMKLQIDTEYCNLLVTSPLFDTKDNRERLMQCLFETFAVPAAYTSAPPVFELYAAGRENGVVVGVGAQCTYAVLIHEGLPDPRTQTRMGVAGDALTAHTKAILEASASAKGTSVALADAARCKEALATCDPTGTGAADAAEQKVALSNALLCNGDGRTCP